MTHPDVRILQVRTEYIVQLRKRFLWWRYWSNAFINLFADGDPYYYKTLQEAEKGRNQLIVYLNSPKNKII